MEKEKSDMSMLMTLPFQLTSLSGVEGQLEERFSEGCPANTLRITLSRWLETVKRNFWSPLAHQNVIINEKTHLNVMKISTL